MNELTDLEICKRIAEIEGVELFNSYSIIFDKKLLINMYMDKGVKWHHAAESEECFFTKVYSIPSQFHKAIYNPLTDDTLCFQLMVKYKLSLIAPERDQEDWDCVIRDVLAVHENPNKAICLAIIEAHKDQS